MTDPRLLLLAAGGAAAIAQRAAGARAASTAIPGKTYNRAAIAKGKYATCPGCANQFQVLKDGSMGRHGWRTYGREVGVYGSGWQTSACIGWKTRPVEQTDIDAIKFRKMHLKQAAHLDDSAAKVAAGKGPDYYTYNVTSERDADVARKAGLKVTDGPSQAPYGGYGKRRPTWNIKVVRGSRGKGGVPTFASLRDRQVKALQQEARAHVRTAEGLRALIVKFRSMSAKDAKARIAKATEAKTIATGPKLHLGAHFKGKAKNRLVPLCKQWAMRESWDATTDKPTKVTCSRCLTAMAKDAEAKVLADQVVADAAALIKFLRGKQAQPAKAIKAGLNWDTKRFNKAKDKVERLYGYAALRETYDSPNRYMLGKDAPKA